MNQFITNMIIDLMNSKRGVVPYSSFRSRRRIVSILHDRTTTGQRYVPVATHKKTTGNAIYKSILKSVLQS